MSLIYSQTLSHKQTGLAAALFGQGTSSALLFVSAAEGILGEVEADKIHITCVPREHPKVQEIFPGLPEIEYIP